MICTCSMHCTRSGYHERACCHGPICDCWCHDRNGCIEAFLTAEQDRLFFIDAERPFHVPAGANEPVGYVRCLPSGAVHPAGYDCGHSACKGCGRPIYWVETEKGARMPLDPEPVEAGRIIVRMGPQMGKATAHAETAEETAARLRCPEAAGRLAFMPHHATCPKANEFSRTNKKEKQREG